MTEKHERLRRETSALLDAIRQLDATAYVFYQAVCEGKDRQIIRLARRIPFQVEDVGEAARRWEEQIQGILALERTRNTP